MLHVLALIGWLVIVKERAWSGSWIHTSDGQHCVFHTGLDIWSVCFWTWSFKNSTLCDDMCCITCFSGSCLDVICKTLIRVWRSEKEWGLSSHFSLELIAGYSHPKWTWPVNCFLQMTWRKESWYTDQIFSTKGWGRQFSSSASPCGSLTKVQENRVQSGRLFPVIDKTFMPFWSICSVCVRDTMPVSTASQGTVPAGISWRTCMQWVGETYLIWTHPL